jgi:hypothetical protein
MRIGCGIMFGTIPNTPDRFGVQKIRSQPGCLTRAAFSGPDPKTSGSKTRLAGSETGKDIFSISVCW